jgi:hypothetical protein
MAHPRAYAPPAAARGSQDDDLSGDDLKRVRYRIDFTKPGYETLLAGDQCALVTYSTDRANFGALKIAEFMEKVARHAVQRPQKWVDRRYPRDAVDDYGWSLPPDDRRYVEFSCIVESRRERQQVDHEREDLRLKEDFVAAITDFLG